MTTAKSANTSKPAFDVVLVNYKTYNLTANALYFLKKALSGYNAAVWVVDNDSADESTQFLRSLDWINLIERKPVPDERGFMAHGCALDMVLEKSTAEYLLLMHTDTMIYDPAIFELLLSKLKNDKKTFAAGCVDQIYRGRIRIAWRFTSRLAKHYFRRLKLALGLRSRAPKPYREVYLKSFCALWNAGILRQHKLTFSMEGMIPGYAAQDKLTAMGYKVSYIDARTIFRYLDHIEAGTVSAIGGYDSTHRRLKKYNAMLQKLNRQP